jgi:hypothetical protein
MSGWRDLNWVCTFVSFVGCMRTFVDEMKCSIILSHYFMARVLILWRALQIILYYFLQLINIELAVCHLLVKRLRFFLEEKIYTHLFFHRFQSQGIFSEQARVDEKWDRRRQKQEGTACAVLSFFLSHCIFNWHKTIV